MSKEKVLSNKQLWEKMIRRDKSGKEFHLSWLRVHVSKPISFLIIKTIRHTNITPIGISTFNLVLLLLTLYTLSVGTYPFLLLSFFIILFSMVLDQVDGDLARVKEIKSRYGGWLDYLAAFVAEFIWMLGISIGAYNQSISSGLKFLFIQDISTNIALIAGIFVVLEIFIFSTSGAQFRLYLQSRGLTKSKKELEKATSNIKNKGVTKIIANIISKAKRMNFLFLCIIFDQLFLALIVYALIFFIYIVSQFISQREVLLKAGYYK